MVMYSISRHHGGRRAIWWGSTIGLLLMAGLVWLAWLWQQRVEQFSYATNPAPAITVASVDAEPPAPFGPVILAAHMTKVAEGRLERSTTKPPSPTPAKPKPGTAGYTSHRPNTANQPSTNGSGGPLADRTFEKFGASQYHLYASHLAGKAGAHGLMIYLHGDGHEEFDNLNNATLKAYVAVARKHGMLLVVPKTPDNHTQTWWRLDAPAGYLANFLQHLYKQYNINQRQVWLAGYSGGAEVLTYKFLPRYHSLIQGGGAVMIGGGGSYRTPKLGGLAGNFRMHWVVGSRDAPGAGGDDGGFDAMGASRDGAQYYQQAGVAISHQVLPGQDHYQSISAGPAALEALLR